MRAVRSRLAGWCLVLCLVSVSSEACWQSLLVESFSADSGWRYSGVSNGTGAALFSVDAVNGCVAAEWNQTNSIQGGQDPYAIAPSSLTRPLSRPLTDRDTFRFGATLRIAGPLPDTFELAPIVSFGLYNLSRTGPDRNMSDNWSGNTGLNRDACNFVEFGYFILNECWGFNPNIQPTIGMHIEGLTGNYIVGGGADPLWHNTDMGADHYLPEGTNLYIEVVYYGASTNEYTRRAHGAVYADLARSNLVIVNGVEMYYWTQPAPTNESFLLTDAGFFNWVDTVNYGGPAWSGAGSFDDFYVARWIPEGELFEASHSPQGRVWSWASVSGQTYAVEFSGSLEAPGWVTDIVAQAEGDVLSVTNERPNPVGFYRVTKE